MLQKRELSVIIINALFVKMLLTFPKRIIENSGNAAWLQILYNMIIALLFYYVIMRIYRGKRNIIQVAAMSGGKILRIITGTAVYIILLMNFTSIMRIYPETVKTILLRNTGIDIIVILFVIVVGVGAYMGIEAIGRIHYLFMPLTAAVLAGFLILLIPYYREEHIMPVLGKGLTSIFGTGFGNISMFSDLILANIFIPHTENLNAAKQCGKKAIIIAGTASMIVMLAYCLIYPYPASEDNVMPVYQLTRMVHISSFFSRFEAFFEFIWSILVFLYSSTYLYTMCVVIEETFGLYYYKPLILPLSVINYGIIMIPPLTLKTAELEKFINQYMWIPVFSILFIFAIISYILNKRGKNSEKTA